jgi:hypothetical protein
MTHKKRVVYLDTCVLSVIADDQKITLREAKALAQLAERDDLEFATSLKALDEILRTPDEKRRAILRFIFALMDKVHFHVLEFDGTFGGSAFSEGTFADDWKDPTLSQLQTIFDRPDAEHITHAINNRCDFFLTLDTRTILQRVQAHRDTVSKICGALEFASPESLDTLLNAPRQHRQT